MEQRYLLTTQPAEYIVSKMVWKDILEIVAMNTKVCTMEGTQNLWELEKSLLTLKVPGVNFVKSQFL